MAKKGKGKEPATKEPQSKAQKTYHRQTNNSRAAGGGSGQGEEPTTTGPTPTLEPGSSSGGQENQGGDGGAQAREWVDVNFPEVVFEDFEQFSKFQSCKVRKIFSTRYLDRTILVRMGIFDDVANILKACGLEHWLNMYHLTYIQLTLEFVSSLRFCTVNGEYALRFRLDGQTRYLNLEDFCRVFSLARDNPPRRQPDGLIVNLLWPKIAGSLVSHRSSQFISDVQHPALRIFFKFCRECLFALPSPHQARNIDIFILCRALCPSDNARVSIPQQLWKHLKSVANSGSATPIHIGGHVTRIAAFFNLNYPSPRTEENDRKVLMHADHLARTSFIFLNPLSWRLYPLNPLSRLPLPLENPPSLEANRASYLIEGVVPAPVLEPPPHVRERPHGHHSVTPPSGAGPSQSGPSPTPSDVPHVYSPFEELMIGEMRGMSLRQEALYNDFNAHRQESLAFYQGMDSRVSRVEVNVQGLNTRLTRFETNYERSSYDFYDFQYRHHMIGEGREPPTWYQPLPTDEQMSGVDLSRFDNLRIGDGSHYYTFGNIDVGRDANEPGGQNAMDQDLGFDDNENLNPGFGSNFGGYSGGGGNF